ncbi:AA9 family lytic polysaccharide monooxygenase B-like [Miscanthus floridulus]|uniref:AA9 family lytic polysaccharide monooxygenase B-like n=1 Tax=Miscanthus floridulus TaxID=154761 RepID=UPI003459DFD6
MEGVSGADIDPSPSTMTPKDPSIAFPSFRPMSGAVTWATDGTGRTSASGITAVALSGDPSITVTATSTCVGGVTTSYVAPATIGATSAVGSPIRPIVGSGIAAIASCSVTSEGAP